MPAPETNPENPAPVTHDEDPIFQEGYRKGFEDGTEALREHTRTMVTIIQGYSQLFFRENGDPLKNTLRKRLAVDAIKKASINLVRMFETPKETSNNGNNDQTPPDSSP